MPRIKFWHKTHLLKYIFLGNLQDSHKEKQHSRLTSLSTVLSYWDTQSICGRDFFSRYTASLRKGDKLL